MTDNINSVPSEEGQTQPEQPSEGTDSGSGVENSEVPSQIPDHLKGKSEQELIQMYQNAEKKIGEQSSEVKRSRDEVAKAKEAEKNVEILLNALQADENLYQQVQKGVQSYLNPDTSSSEGNDGADSAVRNNVSDDTRRTLQNQIVSNFYGKYGIDKLDDGGRQQEQAKLGNALANILDPSGKKSIKQVLDQVPLDQLDGYLESAYIVANKEKIMKNAESRGILNAQQNQSASIGSLGGGSADSNQATLSPAERQVAAKLGVSESDYLKSKQKGQSN